MPAIHLQHARMRGCGSGWCRLLNGRKDEKRELAGCCAHPFQVSRPQKSRYPSPQLRAAPIHRTSLHYWPPSARPSVRPPARPAECRVRFRFCDTTSEAVDAAAGAGGRGRAEGAGSENAGVKLRRSFSLELWRRRRRRPLIVRLRHPPPPPRIQICRNVGRRGRRRGQK